MGNQQLKHPWRMQFWAAECLCAAMICLAPCALGQSNDPLILTNPVSQITFAGTGISLSVTATGTPPLGYQWRKDQTPLQGRTNAVLNLPNASAADSGVYNVIVRSATGDVTSADARLSILPPRMWVMGANTSGQLGDGTVTNHARPISPLGPALLIAGGASHSLFIKPDHTLWTMGNNGFGQLGDGTTEQHLVPVPIWTNVIALAAGANHSFLVDANHELWAFGDNTSGQLGDGSGIQQNTPVSVAKEVTHIAAGAYHSLFITSDGTLWAMGDNTSGQLGDGTTTSQSSPVPIATNVAAVAAGAFHTLYLKTDGTLWAMGANDSGQLGDGTTTSRYSPIEVATSVASVAAGAYHTLFITKDGTLWAMGDNSYQQLGNGTATTEETPVVIATDVASVACGYFHSLFVGKDGSLSTMGANFSGQLGDGTTQQQSLPVTVASNVISVSAGADHSMFTANTLQDPAITHQPDSQSVWIGENVTFKATANQEPDLNYTWQWRKDGDNIPGGTQPTLTLTGVTLSDSANYSAVVTVGDATVLTSSNALLVVAPVGAPTVWADSDEVIGTIAKTSSTVVSLASRLSEGYIFYTLDGRSPTFASTLYNGPFTVSNTVVIRALWLSADFTRTAENPATTIKVLPYILNTFTKGGGMVVCDPAQEYYAANSTVSLVALPTDGWKFLHWDGDATGTNNPLIVTVNSSKHIEAVFGTVILTNVIGDGTIQIVPSGPVAYGSTVQLTAFPKPGNIFVVWGNAVAGTNNPVSYIISSSSPVVGALFFPSPVTAPTITVAPSSISSGPGSQVTLTVQATGGSLSYQWYYNSIAMPGMNSSTLPIGALTPQTAGEYHVIVSGPGGAVASPSAYVSMNEFAIRPVVSIYGSTGMPYRVDYSDDNFQSGTWLVLTNAILAAPRQDIIDFNPNSPKRFYRVIVNP